MAWSDVYIDDEFDAEETCNWRFDAPPENELVLLLLARETEEPVMHEICVRAGWVDGAGIHAFRLPPGEVQESLQRDGWRVEGWREVGGQVFEARRLRPR